ncbi:MAG: MFS transporter [Actinomycetota bacterium]
MPADRPPLWFIFSITVSGILANTLLTPNIPDVLADLGQDDSRAGLLVAVSPLPGVVMAPVIGVIADRVGRRRVLLPCLVLFGAAGLFAAVSPTFELLLLARFLQGVGGAGLINLAVVLIGDHWEGLDRTRLIGRNSAVLTVCLAIIPLASGTLAELTSWRWSLAIAGLALPVAAVGVRQLPDVRPATQRTLGEQLRGAAAVVRTPALLTVLLCGFLLFVVIFGVFLTALPVHLEDEFDLGPGARGLILSVPAVGASLVSFNAGRIRERVSLRAVLVAASALIAVSAFGIGVASTVVVVVVASVLYGVGEGAAIPALQDVTTSAPPPDQRAAVVAVWVSAVRLGQAVGPVVAAALFTATSTGTTMVLGAALFSVVAVVFLVGPISDSGTAPRSSSREAHEPG